MAFTIAVIRERRAGETRVAATPDTVKKFKDLGAEVLVETGAGTAASYTDDAYAEAGAKVAKEVLEKADVVLSVRGPEQGQASALKKGASEANPQKHSASALSWPRRLPTGFTFTSGGLVRLFPCHVLGSPSL